MTTELRKIGCYIVWDTNAIRISEITSVFVRENTDYTKQVCIITNQCDLTVDECYSLPIDISFEQVITILRSAGI